MSIYLRDIVAAFERLLAEGVTTSEFKMNNTTLVAHNIVVIIQMWALRWWFLRDCCTLEEYISELTEFILSALRQGKGCFSRAGGNFDNDTQRNL